MLKIKSLKIKNKIKNSNGFHLDSFLVSSDIFPCTSIWRKEEREENPTLLPSPPHTEKIRAHLYLTPSQPGIFFTHNETFEQVSEIVKVEPEGESIDLSSILFSSVSHSSSPIIKPEPIQKHNHVRAFRNLHSVWMGPFAVDNCLSQLSPRIKNTKSSSSTIPEKPELHSIKYSKMKKCNCIYISTYYLLTPV